MHANLPVQLPSMHNLPVKLLHAFKPTQQFDPQAAAHVVVALPRTIPLTQSTIPVAHCEVGTAVGLVVGRLDKGKHSNQNKKVVFIMGDGIDVELRQQQVCQQAGKKREDDQNHHDTPQPKSVQHRIISTSSFSPLCLTNIRLEGCPYLPRNKCYLRCYNSSSSHKELYRCHWWATQPLGMHS